MAKKRPAVCKGTTKRKSKEVATRNAADQGGAGSLPFVAAWADHRQDRAASRAAYQTSQARLLRFDALPEGAWKAYVAIPDKDRDMVQWRAMERLFTHPDMIEAYRVIGRSKPTDVQWRAFVFAAFQARNAGVNLRVAKDKIARAKSAMATIAEHATRLDIAIGEFWEAATTKIDWWRAEVLQCPAEVLSYPGNRENDNPRIEINQLPFLRPPIQPLIQRLAAAATMYKPVPVDGVMQSALRGDQTERTAFVYGFDATLQSLIPAARIKIGPKPLAIVALVLLRDSAASHFAEWHSWTELIKQHRNRTKS